MIHLVPRSSNELHRSAAQPAWAVLFLCILSISCFGQASRVGPAEKVQDMGANNAAQFEYERLDIDPCVGQGGHVVDDENALQVLIEQDRSKARGYCKPFGNNPPKIDFLKHTLIGARAVTDLCQHFKVKIIRDDASKRYRHILIANKPPRCRGIGLASVWVLIPKLPVGYEVTFENQVEGTSEGRR
jgi:hypothetical protein